MRIHRIFVKSFLAVAMAGMITAFLSPALSTSAEETDTQETQTLAENPAGISTRVSSGTIPKGVRIGGVDVSGMNARQAEESLNDMLRVYDDTRFTFTASDNSVIATGADIHIVPLNTDIITAALNYGKQGNIIERYIAKSDIDMGKSKSFDLTLTCDWAAVKSFLDERIEELNVDPVDFGLKKESGGFNVIEGRTGVNVNTADSATVINEFITTGWDGNDATVELVTELSEPKGSREQLSAVKDLLGSFSTDFSTSSNARASNLRNGASKLNQSVIYPGESYSVSTNLGKRNAENGYMLAGSYENGTTVDTYGGGICQISTTLYNAIIRSELEIVERSPHSMVVSYVKPSMDAAISEGSKDLIFRNNRDYPVYIEGYTSGTTLYFNVYGKEDRPSGRKVSFESEVISTTDPPDRFVADPSLPIGTVKRSQSAHTGYSARLWKIVTVDGVEQSRAVFNNSSYRASSAVYNVGTASDNPDAQAAINAALASQDKTAIDEASSSWSDEGMANRTEPVTDPVDDPVQTPAEQPDPIGGDYDPGVYVPEYIPDIPDYPTFTAGT